jgi:hypothetical protein
MGIARGIRSVRSDAFMPILTTLGADPGQPMVSPVRNIIKG